MAACRCDRCDANLFGMNGKATRGLFVTGTDTGVGKTFVTAMIARELVRQGKRVGVYKPAASGCDLDANGILFSDDANALWEAAGKPADVSRVCPQMFAAPLAPHLAARDEGKAIDAALLRKGLEYWTPDYDIVLVEGAGGLMSPMGDEDYVADLAHEFGFPLLVVAPNVLGIINQTLQTLITAATFRDGLEIAGIVLNDVQPPDKDADPSVMSNLVELEARCMPPVLAHVENRADGFTADVDWFDLAKPPAK